MGEPLSDQERIDLLLSRVQSFRVARTVALAMVQLAGSQAIYRTSILDRLVRDAITINQHLAAGPGMVEAAGQLKLGQQPSGPLAACCSSSPDQASATAADGERDLARTLGS